jgi:hypothetical protein
MYTKLPQTILNHHKIYQMDAKIFQMVIPTHQHFPFQGPPKYVHTNWDFWYENTPSGVMFFSIGLLTRTVIFVPLRAAPPNRTDLS